jgi:hypothetical protein
MYFIYDGTEQLGPFDVAGLKSKKIRKDTPVWYEGLSDWTTAENIEELKEILWKAIPPPLRSKHIPPPIKKSQPNPSTQKKELNIFHIMLFSMGIVISVILIIIAFKLDNSGNNKSGTSPDINADTISNEQNVVTRRTMEIVNPAKYLVASGTYNQNLLGNKMKIHGTIKNNATDANFKNVVVEIVLLNESELELGKLIDTIYDTFPANTTNKFDLKIDKPKACKKIKWDVTGAIAYE